MKVKTFTFDDIRKGMDVIKDQFGPDTIIMDIKQNSLNGNGWIKKGCEISIAVENDPAAAIESDIGEIRKKTEAIWSDAARYLTERLTSIESDMIVDRLKAYPMPLKVLYDRLARSGLDRYVIMSLLSEVYAEIGTIAENSTKAVFFLKAKLGKRIALFNAVTTDESLLLMGPTGSGKTETVKKLAFAIHNRDINVSVIGFDPVRKGSCDELQAFSEKTGIPFQFATTIEDLLKKFRETEGRKLIDVTGHLAYQKEVLDPFREIKKIAVFSAGSRDETIENYLDNMKGISIAGLIFTRLDEERRLGHLCNTIMKIGRPIAAMTRGAGVNDILVPDHETFGKLLIEEKAC